jgi:hypothetical protein
MSDIPASYKISDNIHKSATADAANWKILLGPHSSRCYPRLNLDLSSVTNNALLEFKQLHLDWCECSSEDFCILACPAISSHSKCNYLFCNEEFHFISERNSCILQWGGVLHSQGNLADSTSRILQSIPSNGNIPLRENCSQVHWKSSRWKWSWHYFSLDILLFPHYLVAWKQYFDITLVQPSSRITATLLKACNFLLKHS